MLTCYDVANYFIWLANTLSSSITNMKLQKLVYHAQGYHLALYDEPLFAEQIRAWDHGPVAPPLESDIRKSSGFQAYLASKKKRFEVYRRL